MDFELWYLYDKELKGFIQDSLVALVFFAVSHFVEFISFQQAHEYTDTGFANVINFYCVSLLFMVMGAEYVIRNYRKSSPRRIWAAAALCGLLLGLSATFLLGKLGLSLDADQPWSYVYAVVTVSIGLYAVVRLKAVKKMYGWFKDFIDRLTWSTLFIIIAALPNIFYDILGDWGLPKIQIIYLSHFAFYAALSMMYLAYGENVKIGGIHAEIRKAIESGELEA